MQFDVSGVAYRASRLDARSQFMLLQRLVPILPALDSVGLSLSARGKVDAATAFAAISPLATANEDDVAFVVDAALASCEIYRDGEWWPARDEADQFDLAETLQIIAQVVALNFQPFYAVKRPIFDVTSVDGGNFEPATMPNGLDWLYRPVVRALCKFESLKDGTLHLEDIAEMNGLLDVADENQRRAHEAAQQART